MYMKGGCTLRKLKYLFTVPEGEKITEKSMSRVLISSVCSILICLTCLFSTTWAWFRVTVESDITIEIDSPKLSVDIKEIDSAGDRGAIVMSVSDGDGKETGGDVSDGDTKEPVKDVTDGDMGTVMSVSNDDTGVIERVLTEGTYDIKLTLNTGASEDVFNSRHTSYVIMEAASYGVDETEKKSCYYVEMISGNEFTYIIEVPNSLKNVNLKFSVSWTKPEDATLIKSVEE